MTTEHLVIEYERPNAPVLTNDGTVPFRVWVYMEAVRWARKGRPLRIVEDEDGRLGAKVSSHNFNYLEVGDEA